ncbi:MAG: MFS transporter [Candidatus Bathyarchaeia archaeon]
MSSFISTVRKIYSNNNFSALNLADIVFILGGNFWWTFQSLYILALGASKEELGFLMMFGSAMMLIPQVPGGVLSDRFGRKNIIFAGAILRLIPPVTFILASNWMHLLPGVFINSIALMDNPAWNALLAESTSEETRGTAYSVYRTTISVSSIFTTPIGGVLMDSMGVIFGTRICLMLNEAFLLVYAVVIWRLVKEQKTPYRENRTDGGFAAIIKDLKGLPRNIGAVILAIGLCSFASGLSLSYMVVYATEVIGLTNTQWGLVGAAVNLISTALFTPVGYISDRIGRRICILISQFLWASSVILFINSSSFRWVLLARLLEGVSSGFGGLVAGFMGGPAWQALIADLVQERYLGRVIGLIGTVTVAFYTTAPLIGGYLYDRYAPVLPFQLNVTTTIVSAIVVLVLLRDKAKKG